ncbi:MAG: 30S ribosomal protein S19e [Thermoplasmata archaeon]
MTTVYDVPPALLVEAVAADLGKAKQARPPTWAAFVKTGVHREKSPANPNWWHTRLAAVLRKVYVKGPVGTERLAGEFGGARDAGSSPYHPRKGSRSVIRKALIQLEALGYLKKVDKGGRAITPKGQSYLDGKARQIMTRLAKGRPELTKYL